MIVCANVDAPFQVVRLKFKLKIFLTFGFRCVCCRI